MRRLITGGIRCQHSRQPPFHARASQNSPQIGIYSPTYQSIPGGARARANVGNGVKTRPLGNVRAESVWPSSADMRQTGWHVNFVPVAPLCTAEKQRRFCRMTTVK
jgi:hypothetical protein